MPTREQVQFHNDEQLRLDEERRRREAAIRAEEQSRLVGYQQQQQAQTAQVQQQREGQMFGYQQNLNAQNALNNQIGQYDQYRYQSALSQQGAQQNLQAGQQEHAQTQQRMQYGTDLQAHLSEVQLTQRDNLRRQQLKDAIASLDDDVLHRRLAPEEAAIMRTRLQTGLNPLEGREQQARIIQGMIQTQGIHQQNEMQATLFNQQQSIRSMNPEQRMRMFRSPDGREQLFQLGANGEWMPMDFGEIARREEGHQMGLLQGASGLLTEGQRRQQSGELHPFQVQLARGSVENLAATTASIRDVTSRAQAIHPYQIQQMQTGIANEQARLRAQIQEYEANERIIPRDLARRDQELANMAWALQEHQALFPGRVEEQGLRNAGLRFDVDTMNPLRQDEAEQGIRGRFNQDTIDEVENRHWTDVYEEVEAGTLRRPRRPNERPMDRARLDQEFIDNEARRRVTRDLSQRPPQVNRQQDERHLNTLAGIVAGVRNAYGQAVASHERNNPGSPLPAALQNRAQWEDEHVRAEIETLNRHLPPHMRIPTNGGPAPTPTPRPAGGNLDTINRLIPPPGTTPAQLPANRSFADSMEGIRGTLATHWNNQPGPARARASTGLRFQGQEGSRSSDLLGVVGDLYNIAQTVARRDTEMTQEEREQYQEMHQRLIDNRSDPAVAGLNLDALRLPGEQMWQRGSPDQLRPLAEAIQRLDSYPTEVGFMRTILQNAISNNRGLTPAEERRYVQLRNSLSGDRYGRLRNDLDITRFAHHRPPGSN